MIKCDVCGKEAEKRVQWNVEACDIRNRNTFSPWSSMKSEECDLCDACIELVVWDELRSLRELRAEVEGASANGVESLGHAEVEVKVCFISHDEREVIISIVGLASEADMAVIRKSRKRWSYKEIKSIQFIERD